jgi:hypothetical protein
MLLIFFALRNKTPVTSGNRNPVTSVMENHRKSRVLKEVQMIRSSLKKLNKTDVMSQGTTSVVPLRSIKSVQGFSP